MQKDSIMICLSVALLRKGKTDVRYRLNFKGFTDTRETLFGDHVTSTVSEALADIDFSDIDSILSECVNNIKTKLDVIINKNSIEDIQFYNQTYYVLLLFLFIYYYTQKI